MAKGRGSLADQLAELGNVAPTDYDFEEEADNFDAGRKRAAMSDESEGEEDQARSHALHNLVNVAPSEMRRRANFIEDVDDVTRNKYKGVKATRKEMLPDEDDASTGENPDDISSWESQSGEHTDSLDIEEVEEDVSNSGSENDASYEDTSTEVQLQSTQQAKPSKKSLRFADEETSSTPRTDGIVKATQSDAALLKDLRQRAKDEAQRGRDAKRQIDAWGKLLGMRIRAQKSVRGATRISTTTVAEHLDRCSQDERRSHDELLSTFDQLSSLLFQMQDRLLRSYASTSEEGAASIDRALKSLSDPLSEARRPSKRKWDDDQFDQHVNTALSLHQHIHGPMWRNIIAKWSWRTSTEDINKKSAGKFDNTIGGGLKAMNQSAQDQIEKGLKGEGYERLRKRTRIWRGNESESRVNSSTSADSNDGLIDAVVEDVDVFDDSDFYSALLRELIDSKAGGVAQGGEGQLSSAWAHAANRAAKKHRDVDRKASKGRRLRYDVHEKVLNFMPPIPAETWSTEQIDRLMHQIRSANNTTKADEKTAESVGAVDLGGLRLFG